MNDDEQSKEIIEEIAKLLKHLDTEYLLRIRKLIKAYKEKSNTTH